MWQFNHIGETYGVCVNGRDIKMLWILYLVIAFDVFEKQNKEDKVNKGKHRSKNLYVPVCTYVETSLTSSYHINTNN